MATLTVWKFDSPRGAENALALLERMQKEELVQINDAAYVNWPEGKKKPKTEQLHNLTSAGALGGSFWGLLFGLIFFVPLLGMAVGAAMGALTGSMADVGIDDDFIREVRAERHPGDVGALRDDVGRGGRQGPGRVQEDRRHACCPPTCPRSRKRSCGKPSPTRSDGDVADGWADRGRTGLDPPSFRRLATAPFSPCVDPGGRASHPQQVRRSPLGQPRSAVTVPGSRKETAMSFWDVVWFIFISFAFVAYLMVMFSIISDLFRDRDASGVVKAVWVVALIFLPFLTALVYLIARGRAWPSGACAARRAGEQQQDAYIREVAGQTTPADQIAQARAMLDAGAISQAEYERLKDEGAGLTRGRRARSSSTEGGGGTLALRDLRAFRRWETAFPAGASAPSSACRASTAPWRMAAQAFTALIPLLLLVSALSPSDSSDLVSDAHHRQVRARGQRGGRRRAAVRAPGLTAAIGVLSVVLLVFSGVSLTRRLQRMYLQAWGSSRSAASGVRSTPRWDWPCCWSRSRCSPSCARSSGTCRSTGSWRAPVVHRWRASCSGPRSRGSCSTGGSRGGGCFPAGALTAVGASIYGVATTIYMPRLMESYSEQYGLFGVTLVAGRVVAVHRADHGRSDRRGRRVRPCAGALGAPPSRPVRALIPRLDPRESRSRRTAPRRPRRAAVPAPGRSPPLTGPRVGSHVLHPATDDPAARSCRCAIGAPREVGHVSLARVFRGARAAGGPAVQAQELSGRAEPALPAGCGDDERGRLRRRLVRLPARRPGVFRSTEPAWNDRNLRELAGQIRSPRVLAHIRASTGSPVQQTNCHPFRHGRWLFMHNGYIDGLPRVRRDLAMEVDPALFPEIEGTTDTELLFYLALTYGLEADPPAAVARAVGFVEATGRRHGVEFPIQMTVVTTDGESMWAFRYSSEGRSRSLFHSTDVSTLRAPVPGQPRPPRALRRRPPHRLRAAGGPARSVARGAGVHLRHDPRRTGGASARSRRPFPRSRPEPPTAAGAMHRRRRRFCGPQPARIFAFSAANSCSVRTPCAFSSPSCLSCSSRSGADGAERWSGTCCGCWHAGAGGRRFLSRPTSGPDGAGRDHRRQMLFRRPRPSVRSRGEVWACQPPIGVIVTGCRESGASTASRASSAAMTSVAGIRALAISSPPAFLAAATKGTAHVFS